MSNIYRVNDDGSRVEVDPARFGAVVPMQKAKRLDATDEWPAMGRNVPYTDGTPSREWESDRSAHMLGVVLTVLAVLALVFLGAALYVVLR